MRKLFVLVIASLVGIIIGSSVYAAVPSVGPTSTIQNYPLRTSIPALTSAVIAGVGPGTYNSAPLGAVGASVECTYNQTARTGSSSTVFSIQFLDTQTTTWTTLLSSAAVTSNAVTTLTIGSSIATVTNVALNMSLPQQIRAQLVESGSSSTITGDVTCDFAP